MDCFMDDPNFSCMLGSIDLTPLCKASPQITLTNDYLRAKHTAVIQIPEGVDLVITCTQKDTGEVIKVTCHLSCELLIMNLAKVGDEYGRFEIPKPGLSTLDFMETRHA